MRRPRVIGLRLVAETTPITSLLSQVLVALTIEADNEFEHRTPHFTTDHGPKPWRGVWLGSYATFANFLRFVADDGIVMRDLAAKAGYPPPVHPAYHGMRRWGYVTYEPDIAGSTPKKSDADALVRLTPAGKEAFGAWQAVAAEMKQRWAARGLDTLQAALIPLVDDIDRPLPEYMPSVSWDRRQPELSEPQSRPAIELDLLGLLSQLLLAMTYDFEAKSEMSLGTYSGLLDPLTAESVPTRNLYEITGVAAKEWSSAMNQLAKLGLVTVGGKPKSIALTDDGVAAKAAAAKTLASVEAAWAKKYGVSLAHLRNELERVVGDAWEWTEPYPDNWRAKVKVPHRLAHHPIVSHRGGYPDGS
ncbi:MAG: hypothetical protein QOK28_3968 [Actinomycetota bacterium]